MLQRTGPDPVRWGRAQPAELLDAVATKAAGSCTGGVGVVGAGVGSGVFAETGPAEASAGFKVGF